MNQTTAETTPDTTIGTPNNPTIDATLGASTQLSATTIIQHIEAGEYSRDVIENLARGFLPLPQDDLVAVLAHLISLPDETIASMARTSLGDVPSRAVHAFASNERASPDYLALLMRATNDPFVLEALIRNRAIPDSLIAELALRADAAVQEIIVINQARIIRAPAILDALLANPSLSADTRRRALETREEFFDKKARIQAKAAAVEVEVDEDEPMLDLSDEPIADLLAKAKEMEASSIAPTLPDLPEAEAKDEKRQSIFAKILLMSVSQKVQLAFKGGKTERMILVRDHNKLVCSAVMRNPRMSELECESIAGMRNVDEEVLRLITARREWMSKYNIVLVLVRNPKTPVGVVLPLINRLTLRDLKALKDDKNVSDVVRAISRKLFMQRSQKS